MALQDRLEAMAELVEAAPKKWQQRLPDGYRGSVDNLNRMILRNARKWNDARDALLDINPKDVPPDIVNTIVQVIQAADALYPKFEKLRKWAAGVEEQPTKKSKPSKEEELLKRFGYFEPKGLKAGLVYSGTVTDGRKLGKGFVKGDTVEITVTKPDQTDMFTNRLKRTYEVHNPKNKAHATNLTGKQLQTTTDLVP